MNKLTIHSNSLVILSGPSGCGKSFFASRHFTPSRIVSSDRTRKMICDDPSDQDVSPDAFRLFYLIITLRLKHNKLTIADATNLNAPYRRKLKDIANTQNRPAYLIRFHATLDQCLQNNKRRHRQVEPGVIKDHLKKFSSSNPVDTGEVSWYTQIYDLSTGRIEQTSVELI